MSTTSKPNTLFNISCPDFALQNRVTEALSKLDILQAHLVSFKYEDFSEERFLQFAQGYHIILEAVKWIYVSSNPISISSGLLSEFFIMMEALDQGYNSTEAKRAYLHLRDKVLGSVRVVHIHIRSMPGNDKRRTALLSLHQIVGSTNPSEQWLTFETPDIDEISRQIVECMTTQD